MHDLLVIAIIAAVLALDDRAGWTSLAAEPVFSSLIVGLVFGHVGAALRCGVALQCVWLSIGAACGSRRPHALVGGVVGAGAVCLSLHKTGDPREPLVVAAAVFCALLVGEAAQWCDARVGIGRERWLERFRLPADFNVATRNVTLYSLGSALYIAVLTAVLAAAGLFISIRLVDLIIDRAGAEAGMLSLWMSALPAIAVATIAHAFATRALRRVAALGFLLAVVLSWLL